MTEQSNPTPPEPRRRRWPTVLLVTSLALNVLVLGTIAGAHFRDSRDDRRSPPPDRTVLRDGGVMPFFDALPRDARKRMGDALRAAELGKGPDRAVLAADLRDFVVALRADPFDAGALSAVLDAQNARIEARIIAGRTILIDQIAQMTPSERAAFAQSLEDRFRNALSRVPGMPDHGHGPGH